MLITQSQHVNHTISAVVKQGKLQEQMPTMGFSHILPKMSN